MCLGSALNIFLTSCGFIMPNCLEFSQSSSMHSKWIVSKSDRYCLTSYVFGYISLIKKVKAKFALGGFFGFVFKGNRFCHCEIVLAYNFVLLQFYSLSYWLLRFYGVFWLFIGRWFYIIWVFSNKACFQILIESLILHNCFSSFACFECYNKVPGLLETTEKTRFTLKACYRKWWPDCS